MFAHGVCQLKVLLGVRPQLDAVGLEVAQERPDGMKPSSWTLQEERGQPVPDEPLTPNAMHIQLTWSRPLSKGEEQTFKLANKTLN